MQDRHVVEFKVPPRSLRKGRLGSSGRRYGSRSEQGFFATLWFRLGGKAI
jgi:hypothetical protein